MELYQKPLDSFKRPDFLKYRGILIISYRSEI